MKAWRGSRDIVLLIHNIGTTAVPLGTDPVTHLLEEWVGPRTSLDDLEKRKTLLRLLELEPPSLHTHHYVKPAPSGVVLRKLTFPVQRCIYVPPSVTITNMHAHTVAFIGFAVISLSAMIP